MTSANESVALARTAVCRRSDLLGTQVISQENAARIGIIDRILVDVEQQQVLVFGIRGAGQGLRTLMLELSQVAALGRDALLITSEEVLGDFDTTGLEKIIGFEIMTEDGLRLGKVKDYYFNAASGVISDLVISRLGIPLLSGRIDTTYLLPAEDILRVGSNRFIVAQGAETHLQQQQQGLLQLIPLFKPVWEEEEVIPALPSASPSIRDMEEEEYEEEYEQDYEDEYDMEEEEDRPEEERARPQPVAEAGPEGEAVDQSEEAERS
ncbi:MAG: photosystem reaction center subunit H [Synechococcaceae cyanobacterium SM2_3_1]|nr:photosystem reaction center subunit H [Synechococcaceae cyanobacterium SM2_3_1]